MEARLVGVSSVELVMVSLAFHLFVVGTVIFALCSYDCSHPLLCCRQESVKLSWFGGVFCVCVFSTLCLQVGNRLAFWGGFSCFVSFIWCQLFAWLIRAAIFRLPQPFFVCHQHLWFGLSFFATGICGLFSFFATGICVQSLSFTAFSAIGIRVRLFVFARLALVSGYQCISQFLV